MVETAAPFAIPASGTVGYVYAQPVDYGTHAGLDILTDEGLGKTPVYAAYHGTVKHIYTSVISSGDVLATDGRAAFIVLEHTDVTDKNGVYYDRIYTWYLHMAKQGDLATTYINPDLQIGAEVAKGAFLGYIGDRTDVGGVVPHLHFQIHKLDNEIFWVDGNALDPSDFLDVNVTFGAEGCLTYGSDITSPFSRQKEGNVDVMLIIDASGSMGSNDPQGKRLQAAKAYLMASLTGDRVGVVEFADNAALLSGLRALPDGEAALDEAIAQIGVGGQTNIAGAITMACDELLTNGTSPSRGAILLTDGQHNVGSFGTPQQCFADHGWPIYSFGFGSADMALLNTISIGTGGEARSIGGVSSLLCEFAAVRSLLAGGTPEPCNTAYVFPGETIYRHVTVPPNQAVATFSTSWLGSDIETTLHAPSGRTIGRGTVAPDVTHDLGPTHEIYRISNPEPGTWSVDIYGLDVPEGGEEAIFGAVYVPSPYVYLYLPSLLGGAASDPMPDEPSWPGGALQLDGHSGYATVDDSSNLNGLQAMTVEAWVNTDVATRPMAILSRYRHSNGSNMDDSFFLGFALGHVVWQINAGDSWSGLDDSVSIADGNWHHVAATWDGYTQTIYVDGDLHVAMSYRGTGVINTTPDPVTIGRSILNDSPYHYFQGQLDEVRVWGISRTREEIGASMDRGLAGDEPGLLAYWAMDDDVGSTVLRDGAGVTGNGVLVGGAALVPRQSTIWCDPYEPNDDRWTEPWGPLQRGQTCEASVCQGESEDNYLFVVTQAGQVAIVLEVPELLVGRTGLWVYSRERLDSPLFGLGPVDAPSIALERWYEPGDYVVRLYTDGLWSDEQSYKLTIDW